MNEAQEDASARAVAPKKVAKKTFGTFAGVFTPTTLTILGVIMYIRQPWVVGNAGVVGAMLIVLLAVLITLSTALSLSSITTNIRIGAGGAFSLISQSLGLEIGGAIGIPFYFAQAVAVAMYIFGFREGLQTLIPDVYPLLLDAGIFAAVMGIAFVSTSFVFKIQYVIMAVIVLSIVSIVGGLFNHDLNDEIQLFGNYPGSPENDFGGSSFWLVFAVFFPAVTGVMAGANMSGDLTNPRKNIPNGTISSVLITTVIYLGLCVVAALLAKPAELASNYNVFIDNAYWAPIVLAGLLGATFSSAIGSFVGAPRILLALGQKNILPRSPFLAKTNRRGEPVNAMIITAGLVLFGLSLRNLNTIAPLITMFFMITYAMVNVVALVEQTLGLPSFRPTLRIPLIVPLIGAIGSITIMFIISAFVALAAIVLIIAFYYYLVRQNFSSDAGDSRSGLFTAMAEWSTKKSTQLSPQREVRSWRPDLLIPLSDPKEIRSAFKLIRSIVNPKGSVKLLAFRKEDGYEQHRLEEFIGNVKEKFNAIDIPMSSTFVSGANYNEALNVSMQALNAAFFKPNTIFVALDPQNPDLQQYQRLIEDAKTNEYAVVVYVPYSSASLAIESDICLWLEEIPETWQANFEIGNNDLAVLISILIQRNWKGRITVKLVNCHLSPEETTSLGEMIRFPQNTVFESVEGSLEKAIAASNADINVFSIKGTSSPEKMIKQVDLARISAIYCIDSGFENALV